MTIYKLKGHLNATKSNGRLYITIDETRTYKITRGKTVLFSFGDEIFFMENGPLNFGKMERK